MSSIRVTYDQLESVSSQLTSAASSIESTLSQVKSQVESVSSAWQGVAATDFQNLMVQWNTDANDLHNVLTQIAQNLIKAAQAYAEADKGISQGFNIG